MYCAEFVNPQVSLGGKRSRLIGVEFLYLWEESKIVDTGVLEHDKIPHVYL